MTYAHFRRLTVCCLMMFSSLAAADSSSSLDRLETLVLQQEHQAAWQLATELTSEHEGDPRFDYLFGLTARANGQLHQAVFALERALLSQPHSLDIRLALAVSYYDLGNLPAAEQELQRLAKSKLSDRAANLVQNYLQRIEKVRNPEKGYWQNWLQLGAGQDSNPNSGVEDEFFFIPLLGQIRLFEQSLERESSFSEVQGQLHLTLPQNQHSAFYLSAGMLHSEYSEDVVLSRTYASALAGYQTRWQDYRVSAEVFYRPVRLDGDSYLNYQGLKTSIRHPIWTASEMGLDLTYARHAYAELLDMDKDQLLAESWFSTRHGAAEHKFSLRWGMEDSQQSRTNFNSRDYWGIGYRWQHLFGDDWMSSLSLDYLGGDHDEPHPLFEVVRDDNFQKAELELSYRVNPHWRLLAMLSYMRNDSNIAIYQYRRTRAMLGVRYAF